jgi:hypothetical protein
MNSLIAVLCVACLQDPAADKEIRSLIDKLLDVADEDIGYGSSWSGHNFSAVEDSEKHGARILDGKRPKGSPVIRDLVKMGAKAVPLLIAHLDDARKSKLTFKHRGDFGGMSFSREYDYNRRTAKSAPEGVNGDLFSEKGDPANEHTLTVGDLCFVTLGQIVNRGFSAIRYQPTAIIVVNSPTRSKALLAAIRKEWTGLTPEKHRESLITDARLSDYCGRVEGAILRLGYYFPDSAEKVVLNQLAKPTYCVFRVEEFLREKLYATADAKERKRLFEEWVNQEGPAFKDGLLIYLLEDVVDGEMREEWRVAPHKVLAELFPGVDPAKPFETESVTQGDQARLITAIGKYHSPAVDAAVIAKFKSLGGGKYRLDSDDDFAVSCMGYLIGRGHDAEFKAYCERRIPKSEYHAKELQAMLDRLNGK